MTSQRYPGELFIKCGYLLLCAQNTDGQQFKADDEVLLFHIAEDFDGRLLSQESFFYGSTLAIGYHTHLHTSLIVSFILDFLLIMVTMFHFHSLVD